MTCWHGDRSHYSFLRCKILGEFARCAKLAILIPSDLWRRGARLGQSRASLSSLSRFAIYGDWSRDLLALGESDSSLVVRLFRSRGAQHAVLCTYDLQSCACHENVKDEEQRGGLHQTRFIRTHRSELKRGFYLWNACGRCTIDELSGPRRSSSADAATRADLTIICSSSPTR